MNEPFDTAFVNAPVPAVDIPDYRDIEFEPVADRFRRYTALSTLLYWVPPLMFFVAAQFLPAIPFFPGMLTLVGFTIAVVLIGVYRWVDAGHRGWALREHDLAARSGILWKSVTTLPIARIQHVETSHGPLERSQGLARLKLFTAGGITADLVVIGLEREMADRLREHLSEQIRLRDAAQGDDEPAAD